MSVSTGNRRRKAAGTAKATGLRALGMMVLVVALLVALDLGQAQAQTPDPPPPPPGVEGPWMKMEQIICFTMPTCTNQSVLDGTDVYYNDHYGQTFDYGSERRRQCYYTDDAGPEAHEVNSLYLMMSCRVGMGIGGVAWVGTGVGLMALGWTAFRRSIEALSAGGGGVSALRAAVDVPVGILIMFMAFGIGLLIYGIARYNFLRYLVPTDGWS